jgi:hypothetical protein
MSIWDFIERKHVSLGEAILILLAIGLPIWGIIYKYCREKKFALAMTLTPNKIPKGREIISVKLKARVPIVVERINIRCVKKHWSGLKVRDAPISIIEIRNFGAFDWRTPNNDPSECRTDGAGGYDAIFRPPKNWGEGEFVQIEVEVDAHKLWDGFLSVEARTTQRRLFARRHFTVMPEASLT